MIRKWALAFAGMSFTCVRCGRCCLEYPVELTYDDLVELIRVRPNLKDDLYLDIRRVFFLELGRPGWTFKASTVNEAKGQTSCCFMILDCSQAQCGIYDVRPLSCRLYPFELLPESVAVRMGLGPTRGTHIQFYDTADNCWAYLAYDANCPGAGSGGAKPLMEGDLLRIAEMCNLHLERYRMTTQCRDEDVRALLKKRHT